LTVTATERLALPPAPLQTRVNVVAVINRPVGSLPDVAFRPNQPSNAWQPSASVDDHVSVVLPFRPTLVGLAASETVGAGGGGWLSTTTVTARVVMPPKPRQVRR
jgi:hypothetical protein